MTLVVSQLLQRQLLMRMTTLVILQPFRQLLLHRLLQVILGAGMPFREHPVALQILCGSK